jgi:hypothetical protein
VKVTGCSLPNMCRPVREVRVIESIVLWNTMDLGALAVRTGRGADDRGAQARRDEARRGEARHRSRSSATRCGSVQPFVFNKSNIDNFNF